MHIGVPRGELKFLPVTAADTELVDASVADQIMAAAQHAGVAQLRAEVIVPQIGVGVKMYDMQIGIFAHRRAHRAQRDKVLAAQQKRQLSVAQNFRRAGLNVYKGTLAGTKAQLQVAAVKHIPIGQVLVLIGTVSFQTVAFVAHGRGAKARTGAVACGGIKRRTVQNDTGRAVAAVAADEILYIAVQHQCSSTSRSISSRKAGR